MAVSFDDLIPEKPKSITFDDLVPAKKQAGQDMGAGKAFGISLAGSVPFGQSITSGLAAGAVAPFVPETFGQLYNQAQADTVATQQANPKATLAGNVAGIASTLPIGFTKALTGEVATQGIRGAVNAIPTALSKVGDFVRGGSVAKAGAGQALLRGAKAGTVAAPLGFAYGAGEADAQGDRVQSGLSGAGLAAGLGVALPVAGAGLGATIAGSKNLVKGIKARPVEALDEVIGGIRENAAQAYGKMREIGAVYNPMGTRKVQEEITKRLLADGALNPKLHDKTLAVFEELQNATNKGAIGLEDLDQWRQVLGDVAGNFGDKVNARKAKIMIEAIDDVVKNSDPKDFVTGSKEAVDALNMGRKEWARQSKFSAITDIVRNAGNDANKLKRDLEKFRSNPKKTRGWNKEELDALKAASQQTTGEGFLKLLGKFGFDLGDSRSVGNTALPILGSAGAGLSTAGLSTGAIAPAATVAAIGTAARAGQKAIARGKVENLLDVIEKSGEITQDAVKSLSPADKNKFISQVMSLPPRKAQEILSKIKEKVK